jgi:predicted dithiol-disulfide oxidoreductase (DUF899 family)
VRVPGQELRRVVAGRTAHRPRADLGAADDLLQRVHGSLEGRDLSAYALSDGIVYRTYVTTARGLEPAMAYYALLDRTPSGRDESDTRPHWVRRHDEYGTS